jgi:peptidoglycan/LPS O-acetylase OafA/YrhL
MTRPSGPTPRLQALDGLRGIAIVLVVLSHGWVLWPMGFIDSHGWLTPLFRGGNAAVTVFLVASGFLSYRVLTGRGLGAMQPVTAVVRRVIRVGPAVWTMLVVLMVIAAMDSTDKSTKEVNRNSVLHVLTYTYNWFVQANLVETRPDFGHLWYLSVDMQAFVVTALIAYVLRRRPLGFVATMAGLYVVLVWWRFHVYDVESVWVVFNRTTARMDAFVIGMIAAAVLAWLPRDRAEYRVAAISSLLLMAPVLWWCDADGAYLGWGGTVLELLVAVYIAASALSPHHGWVTTNPVLVRLGQLSLLLYIWHFPILRFVQRHTIDWAWGWKVAYATLLLVVATWLCEVLIERRVARLLAHPEWAQVREHGVLGYLRRVVAGRMTPLTRTLHRGRARKSPADAG